TRRRARRKRAWVIGASLGAVSAASIGFGVWVHAYRQRSGQPSVSAPPMVLPSPPAVAIPPPTVEPQVDAAVAPPAVALPPTPPTPHPVISEEPIPEHI